MHVVSYSSAFPSPTATGYLLRRNMAGEQQAPLMVSTAEPREEGQERMEEGNEPGGAVAAPPRVGRPRKYYTEQERKAAEAASKRIRRAEDHQRLEARCDTGDRPEGADREPHPENAMERRRRRLEQNLCRRERDRESSGCPTIMVTLSREHFMEVLVPLTNWFKGCRAGPTSLTTSRPLWSLCKPILLEALCYHCLHDDVVFTSFLRMISSLPDQCCRDLLDTFSRVHDPWMLSFEFQRIGGLLLLSKWLIYRASRVSMHQANWPQTVGLPSLPLDPVLITHLADTVHSVAIQRGELDHLNRLDIQFSLDGFLHFYSRPGLWDRYASDACLRLLCRWIQDCGQQEMFIPQELIPVINHVTATIEHPWDHLHHDINGYPAEVRVWEQRLAILKQVGSNNYYSTAHIALHQSLLFTS